MIDILYINTEREQIIAGGNYYGWLFHTSLKVLQYFRTMF